MTIGLSPSFYLFLTDLSFEVELLVRSHDCFTLACNMEGIAEVLRMARSCTQSLAKAEQYSLMVCFLM